MSAKKQRMASFTSATLKLSNKHYDELFQAQQRARDQLREAYEKQVNQVKIQWDQDMVKAKDTGDNVRTIAISALAEIVIFYTQYKVISYYSDFLLDATNSSK